MTDEEKKAKSKEYSEKPHRLMASAATAYFFSRCISDNRGPHVWQVPIVGGFRWGPAVDILT